VALCFSKKKGHKKEVPPLEGRKPRREERTLACPKAYSS